MATGSYLPRRLQDAFIRVAEPDSVKALLVAGFNPYYISYFDDFLGTGAGTWPASQNWSYPATVGTGTESISVTTAVYGGALKVTTGANSADSAVQSVGLHWRGTEGYYAIFKGGLVSTASCKFEVGMMDAITNDCAIATKATPTFTATDAACFIFDTTDDTNLTFITVNAGVVGANVDATFTMDTSDHVYELVGRQGFVSGYVDGNYVGGGAITATAKMTPYVASVTRTTAAKTFNLDYMGAVGPRA